MLLPILANWFFKDVSITEMAVSIPTNDIIPKAIISMVMVALNLFVLSDVAAILILSCHNETILFNLFFFIV